MVVSSSIALCCMPLSLLSLESGCDEEKLGVFGDFGVLMLLISSSSGQSLFENILKIDDKTNIAFDWDM